MQKKNPPILVTRPSMPPVEEYEALVREIFDSHYLTNGGAQHQKLEAALARKLEAPYLRLLQTGISRWKARFPRLSFRAARC